MTKLWATILLLNTLALQWVGLLDLAPEGTVGLRLCALVYSVVLLALCLIASISGPTTTKERKENSR